MAFALNLPAIFLTLLVPPALLGIVGGLIGRRWSAARPAAGALIGVFALWSIYQFVWPWRLPSAEIWPFRRPILAAIIGGSGAGICLLLWLSRTGRSSSGASGLPRLNDR
jgi:hypothetical protein